MGCNCSKATNQQAFQYVAPDGTVTVYTSEVQARAAQIRQGGGTYQAVPA